MTNPFTFDEDKPQQGVPDVDAPGRALGDYHQASQHPGDRIKAGTNIAGPVPVAKPFGWQFTTRAPGERR